MELDEQIAIIREFAREYPRLADLAEIPDSLAIDELPAKIDRIRSLALTFFANTLLDKIEQEELSGEDNLKQTLPFSRTIMNPYVEIPAIDLDPLEGIEVL